MIDIQECKKVKKKNATICICIRADLLKWIKDNNLSPKKIMQKACQEIGYTTTEE